MKVFLTYMLLSIFLISCRNENRVLKNSTISNGSNSIEATTKISIVLKDSITISIPKNSRNAYHVTYLYDKRYLYGVNLIDPLKIDIIDLENKNVKKQIVIDKNFFITSQVSNLLVQSEDSIYFLSNLIPAIYLINNNGEIINKWLRRDLEIPGNLDKKLAEIGYGFPISSFLESPYIDSSSGYLFLKINPVGYKDEFGDVDVHRHGVYDLKNRRWISLFGSYEGILKEKKDGRYYNDMHEPYQIKVEDKVYISYPIDNNIYCYNIKDYKLSNTYDCTFEGVEEFPKPLYGDKASDNALIKLRGNTPFYGALYYHSKLKLFSRFYHHLKEQNARSIIIYDINFNILFIKKFDSNWLNKIIPTEDGYVVLPNDEATKMDPDHLNIKFLNILFNE